MQGWLENHLLPCMYKSLFGIDCPICGFQRSLLFLIHGDLKNSFSLYPPLIPVLIFIILCLSLLIRRPINFKHTYFKYYAWFVLAVIVTNYVVKLATGQVIS